MSGPKPFDKYDEEPIPDGVEEFVKAFLPNWQDMESWFWLDDILYRLAIEARKPQWRTMETAPRDGTKVMLYYPDAYEPRQYSLRSWQSGIWGGKEQSCWADDFMQKRSDEPTRWMSLPEAPKS